METREAFEKIDWLLGKNIPRLKFDDRCKDSIEMISALWALKILVEKEEDFNKFIELVQKKGINVWYFKQDATLEEYNQYRKFSTSYTQEEFDLAKRVLNNYVIFGEWDDRVYDICM